MQNTFLLLLLYPSSLSSLKYELRFLSSFFISIKPLSLKTNFVPLVGFYNVIVLFWCRAVWEIFSFQLFIQIVVWKILWYFCAHKPRFVSFLILLPLQYNSDVFFWQWCFPLTADVFPRNCNCIKSYAIHSVSFFLHSFFANKSFLLTLYVEYTSYCVFQPAV